MKPGPMPARGWLPGKPPDSTGEAKGSTAMIRQSGHSMRMLSAQPVRLLPDPTPATR